MTAVLLERRRSARPLPVPVVLGMQEGRRIVLHPVALLGFVLMCTVVLVEGDSGPRAAFETISTGPTFFYGVFTYFAANLVASRDRRSRSGELLAALPQSPVARVAGLCVAALVPMLVALLVVVAADQYNHARDLYVVAPDAWHVAQGPLTVLGGALLGIMVARLTSVPGVALLVMVAMVLVDAWLNSRPYTLQPLATYVTWPVWAPESAGWVGLHPGSPAWHAAYLLSLCAMAATGAFLREAPRRRLVLGVGAACTLAAVVTGLLQLP